MSAKNSSNDGQEGDGEDEEMSVIDNVRHDDSGIVATTEYVKHDEYTMNRMAPETLIGQNKVWVSRTVIRRDADVGRDGKYKSGLRRCLILEVEFGKEDGEMRSWSVRLIEDGKGKQSLRNVDPRDSCDIDCGRYSMECINSVVGEWAESREKIFRKEDDVMMYQLCKDIIFREKERERRNKRAREELEKSFIEDCTRNRNVKMEGDQGEGEENE